MLSSAMLRRRSVLLLLVGVMVVGAAGVCLAAEGAAPAGGTDWPIYRGPAHNGISQEMGWLPEKAELKVLWTAEIGKACSSISVAGGRAYTMGNAGGKDTVFCFDAASGKELWKSSYDCPLDAKMYEGGPNATPTVDGGRVYTVSKRGQVFCLDAATGRTVWQAKLASQAPEWGFAGSVLPLGDLLILNAGAAGTALKKADGSVVWDSGAGPGGYSTPLPVQKGDATIIVLFASKSVVAVNAADGKKIWEHPWKTSYDVNAADPVLVDGGQKFFVSSGYNRGCALVDVSAGTPKELWTNKNMRNKHTNSVLFKDAIYGFDEGTLTCLDLATGTAKWRQDGLGEGSLMLADGKLVILSDKGKLLIAEASPAGFKELAGGQITRGPCWTVPVLAGGRFYARSKTGAMACASFSGK